MSRAPVTAVPSPTSKTQPAVSRRELLRYGGGVGGALLWAVPTVQTLAPAALAAGVGSPEPTPPTPSNTTTTPPSTTTSTPPGTTTSTRPPGSTTTPPSGTTSTPPANITTSTTGPPPSSPGSGTSVLPSRATAATSGSTGSSGSSAPEVSVEGTKASAPGPDVAGGGLARTGFPVVATAALGSGLVAGGVALRRYVRRVESGEVVPETRAAADDVPREPDAWGD